MPKINTALEVQTQPRNYSKRVATTAPGKDPLSAAIATAVRDTVIALADEGVFGSLPVRREAVSIEELGFAIGMSAPKVRHLIKSGMPHMRIGAQTRIVVAEALAWLRENGPSVPLMSQGDE